MQVEKASGIYISYALDFGIILLSGILYYLSIHIIDVLGATPETVHQSRVLFWAGVVIFFVGVVLILWEWTIYTNAENEVKAVFSTCPLCSSSDTKATLSINKAEIECLDCGAQWMIQISGISGKLKTAKLVHPSKDSKGRELLNLEKPKEFWIKLAREGKSKTSSQETGVTHEVKSGGEDIEAKLQKLKELYEKGLLTEEEYKEQKRKLLEKL